MDNGMTKTASMGSKMGVVMEKQATRSLKGALSWFMVWVSALLFTGTAVAKLNCHLPRCDERLILSNDNNTHILARDWGAKYPNRPTLLLLHGYPHSQDAWIHQIKSDLRHQYRLITMDLRGMGESDKPTDPNLYTSHYLAGDVDSVLNAFGVQKFVLVAHSYGAAPAVSYLIINGTNKVAGLVAMAPAHAGVSGLNVTPEAFSLFVFQFNPPSYQAFVQSNKDFITMSYAPQFVPKKDARDMLAQDLPVSPASRFAILTAPAEAPPAFVESFLSGLVTTNGVKTLYIYGMNDAVVKPSSILYLNNLVVGSDIIGYPNQGHLFQLSNTEQFNRDLKCFVDSLHLSGNDYDNDPDDDDEDD
jgi:non-heme chloroperoxidase